MLPAATDSTKAAIPKSPAAGIAPSAGTMRFSTATSRLRCAVSKIVLETFIANILN